MIRPLITGSLTTVVEEGPGLTEHTLEAAVVETHGHSLVPFRTVAGTHRLRHLQEATGVLQPRGGAQLKGHSLLGWKTGSLGIRLRGLLPGQSPWLCEPATTGRLSVSPWSFPGRAGEGHSGLIPRIPSPALCQHCPRAPGCLSGSHLVSDHVPVTWLSFPRHWILIVFMSSQTGDHKEEPMTLKVQLGPLQSQAIML